MKSLSILDHSNTLAAAYKVALVCCLVGALCCIDETDLSVPCALWWT